MNKKTFAGIFLGTMLPFVVTGSAFAASNPNGTGQPGAPNTTCQQFIVTPGNAAQANAPFNPNGNAGNHYAGNPGTPSLSHADSIHAVSQYDIACYQQTTK
ncbi:MAG TPA: hypothetical protein VGT05_00535 [Patescibacteria group bacterium]|nr:hypothetical protein [Patescibacteria group bacterium]